MKRGKKPARDPILVAFGLVVQQRRRGQGLSQEEVAARAGIHRTYYADVERGSRNIGLKNVVKIARGLGMKAAELLKDIR